MLIWMGGGEGQAKARDLNSKQFLASNALPLGHHTWSKENKFTTPPTRLEAKYVSLTGATYQLFEKAASIYFNKWH